VQHAVVPVIETGEGICHLFIHKDADPDKAISIVVNAKCQRPSVCNAMETLLIDQSVAGSILQDIVEALKHEGVELRGCERSQQQVPWLKKAKNLDWETEYLDLILSIKIVDDIDDAIRHISKYGTGHSESIITENQEIAEKFINQVDAAVVYHNASTRFTDGFEFGFGAEIGISTQKIHARGPMGLSELTSNKYCIYGNGQIRE
jgi:glutamate-5-semialdehyde dehydrogenase